MSCNLVTHLIVRHRGGLYALACDDMGNEYYGHPTKGIGYRIWRVRAYLTGFMEVWLSAD